MSKFICFLLAICLIATQFAHGFTFLGKIKLPKLKSAEEKEQLLLGTQKYGDKAICVITGTSSGLGKQTTKALLETGRYHVIGAVRDLDKMKAVAEEEGFDTTNFTALQCDLNSFNSVRNFVKELDEVRCARPVDRFVCNAALYQPLAEPQWSKDGFEQQMQTNFLSQFLLTSLMVSLYSFYLHSISNEFFNHHPNEHTHRFLCFEKQVTQELSWLGPSLVTTILWAAAESIPSPTCESWRDSVMAARPLSP